MEEGKIDGRTREARALRPPMRPEEPRRDAAERAKQIMEHLGGEFGEQADIFYIPPDIVPEGWSYEWKEYLVMGKTDPSRQVELARTGWEPVPASRHPDLMPGDSKESWILRKGMRLMERPEEITLRAKKAETRAASEQMRSKQEQIEGAPIGPFDRTNSGKPIVVNGARGIKSNYGPMVIPD